MGKFSYGVEFYKGKIYDLENTKLFKKKVKEAEEIEKYFTDIVPNIEHVRPYILMSYRLNKKYNKTARIKYIIGLIYASDYIDFDDIINFKDDLDYSFLESEKETLWNMDTYGSIYAIAETYEQINGDNENDICITNDEDIEEIEEDLLEDNDDNNDNDEIQIYVEEIEYFLKDKLDTYFKNVDLYIEEMIKFKQTKKEDIYMVKRGMRDWIRLMLTCMEDIYNLHMYTLKYNDPNVSKYL